MEVGNTDNNQTISKQAGRVLEGVEYAIEHVEAQVNKHLLPRIKDIVLEIQSRNYQHSDELKAMELNSAPEQSDEQNDIFAMFVQVGDKMVSFSALLWDLADTVKKNN